MTKKLLNKFTTITLTLKRVIKKNYSLMSGRIWEKEKSKHILKLIAKKKTFSIRKLNNLKKITLNLLENLSENPRPKKLVNLKKKLQEKVNPKMLNLLRRKINHQQKNLQFKKKKEPQKITKLPAKLQAKPQIKHLAKHQTKLLAKL